MESRFLFLPGYRCIAIINADVLIVLHHCLPCGHASDSKYKCDLRFVQQDRYGVNVHQNEQ